MPLHSSLATYRLQLGPGFGFDDAAALAPYLAELGVSHVYLSPYLQTAPDATHGYAVTDPTRVNDSLGGAEAHARLTAALQKHGLRQMLDIVPNHMAVGGIHNAWWWDILKNGRDSRYASYFDIDWDTHEARNRGKVLLPVLGDHLGKVIANGELQVAKGDDGEPILRYHDHVFPLAPGSVSSHDRLDAINADAKAMLALLDRQHYRLAYWRTGDHELNYRRFFDINTLAGLRVELAEVFERSHRIVLDWVTSGAADGLRVDHPDGLRDPKRYFEELRAAAPEAWVLAEKILEPGEEIRPDWPIEGTTGYDFLNLVQGLFVDARGEEPLTRFYADFTAEPIDYHAMLREKKLQVLSLSFESEITRLAAIALDVAHRYPEHRDHTRPRLREAIRELAADFPVYRTYARPELGEISDEDKRLINEAVTAAKQHRPDLDAALFDFLRAVLTLELKGEAQNELIARFQQLSAPAMAKGAEDTAFYNFNRFIALNEVGGDPATWGCRPEAFHEACAKTQQRWPRTMLGTSTHDTKRSEDVRSRLTVLSQIPERWSEAVRRWSKLNEPFRKDDLPDRNAEYLLYQTLVGAWPIGTDRVWPFMQKAVREAKRHTSWTRSNERYESALEAFVRGVLEHRPFLDDLQAFVGTIRDAGYATSLAQTLVKLTAPGAPDTYQGTELWDLSLVDPDNRRPVDFAKREELLKSLRDTTSDDAMQRIDEGLPKLFVIQRTLELRRQHAEAFGPSGTYEPLRVSPPSPREGQGEGAAGESRRASSASASGGRAAGGPRTQPPRDGEESPPALSFVRGGRVATVVRTRALSQDAFTVDLPAGVWRHALTGEIVRGGAVESSALFARFPVALLVKES